MKKSLMIILAIAAVVIIVGAWFWSSYNKLVTANEGVTNQWAQVEVQYQRRLDLIPNLVASVKGMMGQEQKVFGDLEAARANYAGATTVNAKAEGATQVEGALGRLIAVMENYPQLQSSTQVQSLMVSLEGTENRVSVERNRYNDMVKAYNVLIKRFPMSFMASIYNYSEKAYFLAAPEAKTVPTVNLTL